MPCVLQTKSPRGPSSSRHGSDCMQPLNVCLTGLIPIASFASSSVSRMFRNPSPFSEFSRNRFCATVSSTAMGSGSSDFTRRPSTMSVSCSPSSPYRLKSAAPNLLLKCEKVRDLLPSQIASTCAPGDLGTDVGVERLGDELDLPLAVGELEQPVLDVGDADVARADAVDRVGTRDRSHISVGCPVNS